MNTARNTRTAPAYYHLELHPLLKGGKVEFLGACETEGTASQMDFWSFCNGMFRVGKRSNGQWLVVCDYLNVANDSEQISFAIGHTITDIKRILEMQGGTERSYDMLDALESVYWTM